MPSSAKTKKTKQKAKTNFRPYFLHFLYCLAVIVFLAFTSININNYLASQKVLGASVSVSPLQGEIFYWQNIVYKNPTYIDGYLELAKVDTEIGNKKEAQNLIIKALELDPNSTKITSVQRSLGL